MYEVIFEGEEREKRARPRGGKGKFKGRGKEVIQSEGDGEGREYELGEGSAGSFEEQMVEGDPGGYRGRTLVVGDPGRFGEDRRDIDKHFGVQNMGMKIEESCPRQEWEPEAQAAAYEYTGYYIGAGQNQGSQGADLGQSYAMALGAYDQQGQLSMGQAGAGMKWYSHENYPALPPIIVYENHVEGSPRGQRATSEPVGKYDQPGSAKQVPNQPMVVSSDMMSS